jgi:hypothetical protein
MGIVARTLSSHEPFHYLGPCVESPRETLREERSLGPGGSSCLWGKSRRPPPEDIRCSEKCSGTERIGIGVGLAASPSHTTVHTGPYTAVR